jgi:hypothetical protein
MNESPTSERNFLNDWNYWNVWNDWNIVFIRPGRNGCQSMEANLAEGYRQDSERIIS